MNTNIIDLIQLLKERYVYALRTQKETSETNAFAHSEILQSTLISDTSAQKNHTVFGSFIYFQAAIFINYANRRLRLFLISV